MALSIEQMLNQFYKKQADAGKIINIVLCPICQTTIKTKQGWQKFAEAIIDNILNDPRLKNGKIIKEECPKCKQKQKVAIVV